MNRLRTMDLGANVVSERDRAFWPWAVLLVLAGAIVFGHVAGFEFVNYDDPDNILQNPYYLPPTLENLSDLWRKPYLGVYVPLTSTLWWLELKLSYNPVPTPGSAPYKATLFHLGGLGFHIAGAVAAFALFRRLVQRNGPAFFGALLFLIHPLQVESAAWVTETKGTLSGFLAIMALNQYVAFATSDPRLQRTRRRRYIFATLTFGLSLLAKPSAVSAPLMAMILDVGLLQRKIRPAAISILPWIALSTAIVLVTRSEQSTAYFAFVPPVWTRPFIAGDALCFYLQKLVWPFELGPDYGRTPKSVLRDAWIWWAWLVPTLILVALSLPRSRRIWLTAAGVFLAGVGPVLGFIPFVYQEISTVADRYLYLSMLGPGLALAYLLRFHWSRPVVIACSMGMLLLGGAAWRQSWYWQNDQSLADHSHEVNPASLQAIHMEAYSAQKAEQIEKMERILREAIELDPESPRVWFNLARCMQIKGDFGSAEKYFRKVVELHPNSAAPNYELGMLLANQGLVKEAEPYLEVAMRLAQANPQNAKFFYAYGGVLEKQGRLDEALARFRRAVELAPRIAENRAGLGSLLLRMGQREEGEKELRAALAIDPLLPAVLNNLGVCVLEKGQGPEAVGYFQQALRQKPDFPEAQRHLAIALFRSGRGGAAIEHYRRGISLTPDWWSGMAELAWILSTHPDQGKRNGAEAVALAQKVCEATNFQNAEALETLAAASAEIGQFRKAAALLEKALPIRRAANQIDHVRRDEERLDQYRRNQPTRDERMVE